jgi:PAS domain S-box-containing protein
MPKDSKQIDSPQEPASLSPSDQASVDQANLDLANLTQSHLDLAGAEATLKTLAEVFFQNGARGLVPQADIDQSESSRRFDKEERYRTLVEQLPAVVFMASLDKGTGDAYVSPQIEASLGFSQSEWLQDPIRWYEHIHPEDKARWSLEAAQMFLSGAPLKSAYRVIARDGRVVWFQCEAKMLRREDGRPWAIHGVGFDITDLKNAEQSLVRKTSSCTELSTMLLPICPTARCLSIAWIEPLLEPSGTRTTNLPCFLSTSIASKS